MKSSERRGSRPEPLKGGSDRRITTALYNYIPEEDGELALTRGKLVTLLAWEGNWWRGESQGEVRKCSVLFFSL